MDAARPREHRVFAALYDRMTGPLEQGVLGARRARLLADLAGQVLDVGAGTGANLPYLHCCARSATRTGRSRKRGGCCGRAVG